MLEKKEILTTGKAKSLYTTSDPSKLIIPEIQPTIGTIQVHI